MCIINYTPEELKDIDSCVEEAVGSLIRQEAEKDLRKDIITRMKEEFSMKPATFNMLVGERFDSKSSKNLEKHEEIVNFNDKLIARSKQTN